MVIGRLVARAAAVSWTAAVLTTVLAPAAMAKPVRIAAPVLTSKPAALSSSTTASFTWNAVTGASKYTCVIDGVKVDPCTSGWTKSGLKDGSHSFSVRAVPSTGKASAPASYTWRVDTLPPAKPLVSAPPTPTRNTAVSVGFSDSDSSVTGYFCALDGVEADCSSPFARSGLAAGKHTLVVTAHDAAGNRAAAAPVSWLVDPNAPLAAVVTGPPAYSPSSSVSVGFTADDQGAAVTFTCKLDNDAAAACTSPFTASALTEGLHKLTIVASDAVGAGTPVTVSWTVDTVAPPAPHLVSGPAPRTNQHTATVVFGLPELGTAAECRVDSDAFASCTSPWTAAATLADGNHTVDVRAVDLAGNKSGVTTSTFVVDSTIPSPAQILAGPSDPSNVTQPAFTIIETDPSTVAFACTLDGGTEFDCTTPDPFVLPSALTQDGQHVLSVVAVDDLNQHSNAVTWTWTLDTVVPATPVLQGGNSIPPVQGSSLQLPITADPNTVVTCVLDNVTLACNGGLNVTDLATGTHTLTIVSTDAAGNVTTSTPITFTSDATPPTATIAKSSTITGPTTVTFSEDVNGAASTLLQLASDTTHRNIAARVCRSAAGATVACTGTVRSVVLTPSSALLPGERYSVLVPAVTDLVGNAGVSTTTTFRGAQTQQETSGAISQTWRRVATSLAFGGSYLTEGVATASASYTFTGTSITWYTVTGPNQGIAKVYVDNVLKATVNNYTAATRYKVARVVKGLSSKRHTLRIVVTGTKGNKLAKGTQVSVDAVRVGAGTVTATPTLRTTWRSVAATGHGRWAQSNQVGDAVSMRFRGTGITLATVLGPDRGIAQILVDGKLRMTVNGYSSTVKYGVLKTVTGLTNAVHTVQVVVTGKKSTAAKGTWVSVDFLRVV